MRWLRRALGREARGAPLDAGDAARVALRAALELDLDRADEVLSAVVRADSAQADLYLALALVYRRRGEVGRAIRVHQNLLLRPDLPESLRDEALRGLAADFRSGGFLQRAIASYEEFIGRQPRDPAALDALVGLHAELRDFPRALERLHRLARVTGRDESAREARLLVDQARAARAEGRSDDARKALRRALRLDPGCASAWIELGSLEAERGRGKRALAAWQRVPALDRRAAGPLYARIEATFASLGRAREFEPWLRGLLAERKGDVDVRLALVRHLAARGDDAAALTELDFLAHDEGLVARVERVRLLRAAGRDAALPEAVDALLTALDASGVLRPPEPLQ